jgi:NAD+ synthase (glutamine-hydrolysing)
MIHGIVKISAATPNTRIGDVNNNLAECVRLVMAAEEKGAKILVFPELCLTGATLGDLFASKTLLDAAERAVAQFADATEGCDVLSVIGLPVMISGKIYNSAVAVHHGEILGIVPKTYLSSAERRWFSEPSDSLEVIFADRETVFDKDIIFSCDSLDGLTVGIAVGSDIYAPVSSARLAAAAGATVILNPYSAPETAGRSDADSLFLSSESRALLAAVARGEAGIGESGTDGCYSGRSKIAYLGKITAEADEYRNGLIFTDVDVEYLNRERFGNSAFTSYADHLTVGFELDVEETVLDERPRRLAFVPEDPEALRKRCAEILGIQSHALAMRISRSYSKCAVIGISGGLDSTLALLAAVEAMDTLGETRDKVVAVTMPCFGTTARTKSNAERLAESLGATLKCIDIKAAVNQHFKDIGHSAEDFSVVYENAQARERTQVLMDIANACGGLVVGTGDLSELALGWATYNGDHMSMYGVNSGVPKTMMRHIVKYYADRSEGAVKDVLLDVLDTPVSPELLPPKDGEIAQCTEGIVGPYELHDFFLYYLVRRGCSRQKIFRLACCAFDGEYDALTIRGWLDVFMRRFFSQQFKRSCLPDGPKVGSVGFSPRGDFVMPSDVNAELWK